MFCTSVTLDRNDDAGVMHCGSYIIDQHVIELLILQSIDIVWRDL